MKLLTAKIDEPINLINAQVKAFEEKRVKERRERIQEIYQELAGDMAEYCDLGRIYDRKWENATTTEKMIRESIFYPGCECQGWLWKRFPACSLRLQGRRWISTGKPWTWQRQVSYINNYERQKAEILKREEGRRRQEEERQRREEEERIRAQERAAVEREKPDPGTSVPGSGRGAPGKGVNGTVRDRRVHGVRR